MLKLLPNIVKKNSKVPIYLIHYVTNQCNAKCPHCFIWGQNDPRFYGEVLTLEQIQRLTRSIGRKLYNVCLTGGETFLRQDIEQICDAYIENSGVQVIQLFTNGCFEDRAYATLESLSRRYPDRNFALVISIDDLNEKHNEYRKLKGGFEKALSTYERVRGMKRHNIDLDIGLTVNHANQNYLDEIYNYLINDKKYRTLSCTLVRGNPLDPNSKDVDLTKYQRFADRINKGLKNGELDCFKGFAGADILNAKSILLRDITQKIIKEGYQSPCYAGTLIGVIYANGEVYPCEILEKPIGNLKEYDMSLKELWGSSKAKNIRNWIRVNKCYCTHECSQTVNILFNPKYYPKLLLEYCKIKLR